MSAVYTATPAAEQFQLPQAPTNNKGFPYRNDVPARKAVSVPGSAMQDGMATGTIAHDLSTPRRELSAFASQTKFSSSALSAPVLQSASEKMATSDRPPYLSPRRSGQFDLPSISPSRSSNTHLPNSSQIDKLLQQNVELSHELDELRAERDQTQAACDNMLTELITTQDTLQEQDTELHSLRELVSRQENNPAQDGGRLSRNDEKELRDLRLRCHRLQGECRRKDEEVRQAQTQASMHQNMYGQATSPAQHNHELADTRQRLVDAESRANHAVSLHQTAQSQADAYAQQLHEWSVAYDGLKASYNDLQGSHTQLTQNSAIEKTRSEGDDQAKAALDDVKRIRDFFQQNSEKVARKNIEVTAQMRQAQDALHARTIELEQQKGMLKALQNQV